MIRFVFLCATLAALIFAALLEGAEMMNRAVPSFAIVIILFVAISHVGQYGLLLRFLDQEPIAFVKIYLGITVLRILFFGIFIFVLMRIDPKGASSNAILFLVCYFLFTTLEVAALFIRIRMKRPST